MARSLDGADQSAAFPKIQFQNGKRYWYRDMSKGYSQPIQILIDQDTWRRLKHLAIEERAPGAGAYIQAIVDITIASPPWKRVLSRYEKGYPGRRKKRK